MEIDLKILRYDPEKDKKGRWEYYKVDAEPEERILDLLHKKWLVNSSYWFRELLDYKVVLFGISVISRTT